MNIDFHYYGTYLAACIAGYNKTEAEKIAYIAQYVDEADEDVAKNAKKSGIENAIYTTQGGMDCLISRAKINRKCWVPFHFLPGNINGRVPYNGKPIDSAEIIDAFKLMCLPLSELSTIMIHDSVQHGDNLTLAGLRMHVFADTWAHAYFSGTTFCQVNDIEWKIEERVIDRWETCKLTPYTSPCDSSIFYLGHFQARHAPDNGYLHYRFKPKWNSNLEGDAKYIERNNPQIFTEALVQMVAALQCIRMREPYSLDRPRSLGAGIQETIRNTFNSDPDNGGSCCDIRSQRGAILRLISHFGYEAPVEFNKEYLAGNQAEFASFFDAANHHFDFVRHYLNLNNITLIDG